MSIIGFRPWKKKQSFAIAVIDSSFPQETPHGFRNHEITEYLLRREDITAFTMPPTKPRKDAWFTHRYGMKKKQFIENKKNFCKKTNICENKIHFLEPCTRFDIKLAYTFFLAETFTLFPVLEKNNIPFVWTLYPGGGFLLGNKKSDEMIKKICSSRLCKKVIATQKLTRDYLLNNHLCRNELIELVFGGFVQIDTHPIPTDVNQKTYKSTLDICFVANKYTPQGKDKGFDLVIDAAQRLMLTNPEVQFHIVGPWDNTTIPTAIQPHNIKYYGLRTPDFFPDFFSRMDIFLSPNRPSVIFDGAFDGFPLGADASYCGVALMLSDVLKMNTEYNPDEIILIEPDSDDICEKIIYFNNNKTDLYQLAENGMNKTRKLFNTDYQINRRLKIFDSILAEKR